MLPKVQGVPDVGSFIPVTSRDVGWLTVRRDVEVAGDCILLNENQNFVSDIVEGYWVLLMYTYIVST